MSKRPLLLPDDVNEIISILDGTPYDRFDLKTPRLRVSLLRSVEGWTQEWHHAADESAPVQSVVQESQPASPPAVAEEPGVVIVRPPLPGTFYRAPKPGAPPFVEEGAEVGPDTVIGIIETMKVMNSVMAGVRGTVVQIVAADGAMVSPSDMLLRVRIDQ